MQATDFANSYMTWTVLPDPTDNRKPGHKPWGNSARILLDARCTITDEQSGQSDEFFLILPCRTEWVYQEENLFQVPSREYRCIYSRTRGMSVGKAITHEGERPSSWAIEGSRYTSLDFTVRSLQDAQALETHEDVVRATSDDLPIVAQTKIWDRERGLRAMLEYPVKTMNFHPERKRFQVDTGPLLLPDFASTAEHWIERLDMAHVAYNTFDRGEFIIRRPTPVLRDGSEVCSVLHYSEVRVHEAKHTVLCSSAGR